MRKHRLPILPAVAVFLTVAFLTGADALLGAPAERLEIVDRAIEYHGGELYQNSETELDVCSKSGCFHVRARLDGGRFAFEVRGQTRDGERRVEWSQDDLRLFVDGEETSFAPEAAQGLRDWVNARVYFCFLPFRLNDPSVYKEDLGLESWNDRDLHKVKVTFAPGSSTDANDEYLYWLDPETGRVEQFAYSFHGRPGGLRFRRAVSHRRVGGLLFFDQENLGVEGKKLSVDQITPEFVAKRMREISVVTLESIEVKPLGE